jgi:uncharacterized membrane protein (DUF106 family)
MKKEITLGQLVSVAVTVIIALATGWITQNSKVSKLEEQVLILQERLNEQVAGNEKKFDKIDRQLSDIQSDTRQILINLERKADRK